MFTQYVAALTASLGAFVAGTALAWTSSSLFPLKNSTDPILDRPITDNESTWIASLLAIGALIGAFPAGCLADKVGRKYLQMGLSLPFIVSWMIITFVKKILALYIARFLAGVATGGICVAAPLYIGEIAENSIRGRLGSYFQLLLTMGILFSYVVGAFVDYTWLSIISCVPAIIFLIIFIFVPESPFYHVLKHKTHSAETSLKWLRGKSANIQQELNKIEEEVREEVTNKGNCKDLISSKANKRALFISLGLMFFQQLCGINAVIFYAAEMFEIAETNLDSRICAIIVGVSQVVFTYVATLFVDRLGRKLLLLISSGVMVGCLFSLGVYFQLKSANEDFVNSINWLPLASVNIFIACFSLGFGPLPWMMMGEIFPPAIKEAACALAVTLNWLLVFTVIKTFDSVISVLGPEGAFWLFTVITSFGIVFICFVVKETKGKSFGEIQKMLGE